MSRRTFKIGLIGTGEMARTHVTAWHGLGVEPVVHSRRPDRGRVFAAANGLTDQPDLDALLEAVDVVDICTPTDTHAELAFAAAAAGRHVICEKPMARTLESAESMLTACADAGVHLLVGHTVRYLAPYVIARDQVLAGAIGRPERFVLHRGGEFPPWADWFAETGRSGGVLVDLAIHDLDYARWLGGEVAAVTAELTKGADGGLPQRGRVELTHMNGAISQIAASWEAPGTPFRPWFELVGSAGTLHYDTLPTSRLVTGAGEKLWEDDDTNPYAEQLADFLAVLAGERAPRVSARDALAALRLAFACQVAADSGESVTL